MTFRPKLALAVLALLVGVGVLYPLRSDGVGVALAQGAPAAQPAPDTATVKLHISGMTCGSCPVTARTALQKLAGVYGAVVTLDDSLGVVR